MKEGLSVKEKNKLIEIAKYYKLDLLILFGSRSKNSFTNTSDVDLAFWKKDGMNVTEEMNLFDSIGDVFEEKPFDIINLERNYNIVLREQIFYHGECLYESEKGIFEREKEIAYLDYIDSLTLLQPLKKKYLES